MRVLERYDELFVAHIPEALSKPTSREVAAHIMYSSVELNTRFPDRAGCLGINGSIAGSDDWEPVRQALIGFRELGEARLRERFERAQAEGDLPASARPDALAAFVMALLHGMAIQAKAGFERDKLNAVVDQALSTWPGA